MTDTTKQSRVLCRQAAAERGFRADPTIPAGLRGLCAKREAEDGTI